LTKYPDFKSLLFHEKLYKVLPGFPNIKAGNEMYEKIFNYKYIKENGALAIGVKVLSSSSKNIPKNKKN
jgi:ASC-1-like (ASCH) protein